MNVTLIAIESLIADPNNPRSETEANSELVASLKIYGVKVPLIGYSVPGGVMLGDGHRRLEAAREAGMKELPVIVFSQKPGEAELLATQLTINGHRRALNPVDEFEAFTRLARLKNWSPSELARELAISNSEVTRVMAIGTLSAEERQLVRDGKISKSSAYALSRLDPEQRSAMVNKAASGQITRDQLNCQARRKTKGEDVKTRRVSCQLAGGTVSVQSDGGINLGSLIDLLEELLKEVRRARTQGLDISTAVRVMRDRSRTQIAN